MDEAKPIGEFMNTTETIFFGVVAGTSTSFIIFLLIQVFNKIVVPWYRTIIYSGLSIDGTWELNHECENSSDFSKLTITQHAHSLKGLMTTVKNDQNTGEVEVKNFTLSGSFHDGHVVLSGNNANAKFRGHVTFLLNIANGGKGLVGVMAFVDAANDKIVSTQTTLVRKND